MKCVVYAALALLLSLQQGLAHAQCSGLFASQGSVTASDSTDRLISYLSQLLESNAIGERELVTLREGANPIPHKQTVYGPVFETSARSIQYQVVQTLMQSGSLDQTRINAWVDQKLQENSKARVQREEVREETRDLFRPVEFHRLPPGEFEMGKVGEQVPVKLTHSIEMMASKITQKMWVDVMGENPHFTKGEPDIIKVEVNGETVQMQPDHPVAMVSWWSVVVFANRLSEKKGLKPAYDLSEMKFSGRAEDGTLKAIEGEVKIRAPDGDIYQAEGFRLPTEAEQEYVLRDLGRAKGEFPHNLTEAELPDYAWTYQNSGGHSHAVGTTLEVLSIDGKVFDDLIGNGDEWSHDYLEKPTRSINPAGLTNRFARGTRGRENQAASYSMWRSPDFRDYGVGARLVRTIK